MLLSSNSKRRRTALLLPIALLAYIALPHTERPHAVVEPVSAATALLIVAGKVVTAAVAEKLLGGLVADTLLHSVFNNSCNHSIPLHDIASHRE